MPATNKISKLPITPVTAHFLSQENNKNANCLIAWKVKTIAGGTMGHVNGVGSAAKFQYPKGLMINSTAATTYVADAGNHRVRK